MFQAANRQLQAAMLKVEACALKRPSLDNCKIAMLSVCDTIIYISGSPQRQNKT